MVGYTTFHNRIMDPTWPHLVKSKQKGTNNQRVILRSHAPFNRLIWVMMGHSLCLALLILQKRVCSRALFVKKDQLQSIPALTYFQFYIFSFNGFQCNASIKFPPLSPPKYWSYVWFDRFGKRRKEEERKESKFFVWLGLPNLVEMGKEKREF